MPVAAVEGDEANAENPPLVYYRHVTDDGEYYESAATGETSWELPEGAVIEKKPRRKKKAV